MNNTGKGSEEILNVRAREEKLSQNFIKTHVSNSTYFSPFRL